MKRTRPDLPPAVPFLTTRLSKARDDDLKKHMNVVEYLSRSWTIPLTLEADESKLSTLSIDATYEVYEDYKGHTGGSFTMVKGSLHTPSCKKRTNAKSSTEANLITVNDCIAHILRIGHFVLEQGYKTAETITILQDNPSVILLEQNGILSPYKRTNTHECEIFLCQALN